MLKSKYTFSSTDSMIKNDAANIFVQNDAGEILAVSRKYDHTAFGLPGGKLEDNETIEDAAKRELFEETGLEISNLKLIFKLLDDYGRINYTFTGDISGEINTSEPHVVKWVDKQVLLDGPFSFYNTHLFKQLKMIE